MAARAGRGAGGSGVVAERVAAAPTAFRTGQGEEA
jgi:hypothetical protein